MKIKPLTNVIDGYLLKSGMPKDELCVITRRKRAFYYYGILVVAALGLCLLIGGLFNIFT